MRKSTNQLLFLACIMSYATIAFTQPLEVTATLPSVNAVGVPANFNIIITFNQAIQLPTANDFYVYSESSGLVPGSVSVVSNILTFNPHEDFRHGDVIGVHITQNIKTLGSNTLPTPLLLSFTISSPPLAGSTTRLQKISNSIRCRSLFCSEGFKPVDFDGDNDIDLVAPTLWLENDGTQNFTTHHFPDEYYARDLEVVDLYRDSDMDVVLAIYGGVFLLENDGNMEFTAKVLISTSYVTESVSISDQNGDGMLDILYAEQYYDLKILAWLVNNGDGSFTQEVITTTDFIYKALPVDLDNDRLIDVVGIGENFLYWYRNNGGSYTRQVLESTGTFYNTVTPHDLDGDNDLDILISDWKQDIAAGKHGECYILDPPYDN